MTPQEFCYWLQGRAELLPDQPPSADEWKMIREHLALVFHKVTPPLTGGQVGPAYITPAAPQPVWPPNPMLPSFPPGPPVFTC